MLFKEMALIPDNDQHLLQIQAGTLGRNSGHSFEEYIANYINNNSIELENNLDINKNIYSGNPAKLLVEYIAIKERIENVTSIKAICTGILATSEKKNQKLTIEGKEISKSKSDLVIIFYHDKKKKVIGVSTKQCNNKNPTNAQLYFTTATGFSELLRRNKIDIPLHAENALKQFCGDKNFRPVDNNIINRKTDSRRYYWEEINEKGKEFWEQLFEKKQKRISEILFKFAYDKDNFIPQYLIHKTKFSKKIEDSENAIFQLDNLIDKSIKFNKFYKKFYNIRDEDGKLEQHEAPRFGIIQMQRGGQKQHPTQLQFNLMSGYFYKI